MKLLKLIFSLFIFMFPFTFCEDRVVWNEKYSYLASVQTISSDLLKLSNQNILFLGLLEQIKVLNISNYSIKDIIQIPINENLKLLKVLNFQLLLCLTEKESKQTLQIFNISNILNITFSFSIPLEETDIRDICLFSEYLIMAVDNKKGLIQIDMKQKSIKLIDNIEIKNSNKLILTSNRRFLFVNSIDYIKIIDFNNFDNPVLINKDNNWGIPNYHAKNFQLNLKEDRLSIIICSINKIYIFDILDFQSIKIIQNHEDLNCESKNKQIIYFYMDKYLFYSNIQGVHLYEYSLDLQFSFKEHSSFIQIFDSIFELDEDNFIFVTSKLGQLKIFEMYKLKEEYLSTSIVNSKSYFNVLEQGFLFNGAMFISVDKSNTLVYLIDGNGNINVFLTVGTGVSPLEILAISPYMPYEGFAQYGFYSNKFQILYSYHLVNDKYILYFLSDEVNIFDKKLEINLQKSDPKSKRLIKITEIDNYLYIIPWVLSGDSDLKHIMAIKLNSDLTGFELKPTNIEILESDPVSICSCKYENKNYIIFTYDINPLIYIAEVGLNYYDLNIISNIFIGTQVNVLNVTSDCKFLYAGGSSFSIIEISSKRNPKIIYQAWLNLIYTINIYKNNLYIMTDKNLIIIDVTNPYIPILKNSFYYSAIDRKEIIYSTGILYDKKNDEIFIYKGSNYFDQFNYGDGITIFEEKKNPYYIFVPKKNNPIIGLRMNYNFKMLDTFNFRDVSAFGKIKSVFLIDLYNSLKMISLPDWIEVDQLTQIITINSNRDYANKNITLQFTIITGILNDIKAFEQTITFPYSIPTLFIKYDKNNKIFIETFSTTKLTLTLTINNPVIIFLTEKLFNFNINYLKSQGIIIVNADLIEINSFLMNLRYTNYSNFDFNEVYCNITIDDQINPLNSLKFISLSSFKKNIPPKILISQQDIINKMIDDKLISFLPEKQFQFKLNKNNYFDDDNDTLDFYLFYDNINAFPNWLSFDYKDLILLGKPRISDEGNYSFFLYIDDGYDFAIDYFTINVFKNNPIINIPLINQLQDNLIYVGSKFNFQFGLYSFLDKDDPSIVIKYSAYIKNENETINRISSDSNYWLKFSAENREFYGSPTFLDICNQTIVYVIADNGFKQIEDIFILRVQSSLMLNVNNELSILFINKLNDTQSLLNVQLILNQHKLIISKFYLDKYNIIYNYNENNSKISLKGSIQSINFLLKYVFIKQNNFSSPNDSIIINIQDELNQKISHNIPKTFFSIIKESPKINLTVFNDYYLSEIGSNVRFYLPLDLIIKEKDFLSYYFSINVINAYNGTENFLSFDPSTLAIFTSKPLSTDLRGNYKIFIKITDEFKDSIDLILDFEVDYSLKDKIIQILNLAAAIGGPLLSILAGLCIYHRFYNYFMKQNYSFESKNIFVDQKFCFKYPLILNEYNSAIELFEKLKLSLQNSKRIKKNEWILDILNKNGSLKYENSTSALKDTLLFLQDNNNASPEKNNIIESPEKNRKNSEILIQPLYKIKLNEFFNNNKKNNDNIADTLTIDCLIEGLLIKELLKFTNYGIDLYKKIRNEIEKKGQQEKKKNFEWFNYFVVETFEKEYTNTHIQLNKILQAKGKFNFEKNLYIDENKFNNIFEKCFDTIKIKKNNAILDKNILKFLLLRSILVTKRGINFEDKKIKGFFQSCLSAFGLITYSYKSGNVLKIDQNDIDEITIFNEKEEEYHFCFKTYKYLTIGKQKFKTFDWIKINEKKGILIFKGQPSLENIDETIIINTFNKKKLKVMELKLCIFYKNKKKDLNKLKRSLSTNYNREKRNFNEIRRDSELTKLVSMKEI